MMRRYGEAVKNGQLYRRRPGVYAILPRKGAILLTFQAEPKPEIQLPGGGIDPGENPVPALHREVFEETGWHITGARRLGAYKRFTYMPDYSMWAEKICHIYLATPTLCMGPPSEPGHTALWVSPAEAMDVIPNAGERDFLWRLIR